MDPQRMIRAIFVLVFIGSAHTSDIAASKEGLLVERDSASAASLKLDPQLVQHKSGVSRDGDKFDNKGKGIKPTHGDSGDNPTARPSSPSEITGKDGAPLVLVPAGVFTMGSDGGDDDEFPIHRVQLDAFYIDKFEVTNGQFAKFVDAIQSEPPWGFEDQDTPVIRADHPVRWVSWFEAVGYCFWAGRRLPTEAEWEKAARGVDGRVYPWGNDHPTPVHAVYNRLKTVSAIGTREIGKSPYGVYDLAGNLYEWVMDWYEADYYANFAYETGVNPRGPNSGTTKVQRGGSYANSSYRIRSSYRAKGDPLEQHQRVGFRCAQDIPHDD